MNAKYLLDTGWVVRHLRGKTADAEAIGAFTEEQLDRLQDRKPKGAAKRPPTRAPNIVPVTCTDAHRALAALDPESEAR